MGQGDIRIGIVGAGQSVRKRHLPGLRNLAGVRITGVCNRHRESASRVAREFDIPRIYSDWEELISDHEIDAVLIGAWPYLHCPVTLAALDAGKHVLTQARMAMNARESQRMLDKAKEHPSLTAMIVPTPFGLSGESHLRSLIADGFLGDLRELRVDSFSGDLAAPESPMTWRQMTRYSGFNMLTLGVVYEAVLRWAPPADRVMAYASKQVERRLDPELGKVARVGTPDSIQVLTTQEGGSVGVYRLSGLTRHERKMTVTLVGSDGTLVYDLLRDEIRGARSTEHELRPLPIPPDIRGRWRVEEDFVAAIRGERPVTHTDFATGARYMQFTEAVARSSRHQVPVRLPLQEFSNPSL
ncbi:4-carboxy-2-hydroxymuconate-6-semialdehyde dehydrogenase [Aquisphaera giovannonii]|uniref:4-carboxy-2-hydroxymuconate-6-semialdehyde dehydrogenase n=1 Tax=Aquisphaera giovannonii TaxID=406548 RepID=A0A5B9W1U4_9BACT|nr:Gfo/Idh/MocA family oxidoreductase [Aquisphaera giovannonii]QEH33950.1 4-carboxy-2-hydroxymuconate-6-semialdehyde dehydrogenase [Aquisphaera giovannonii]